MYIPINFTHSYIHIAHSFNQSFTSLIHVFTNSFIKTHSCIYPFIHKLHPFIIYSHNSLNHSLTPFIHVPTLILFTPQVQAVELNDVEWDEYLENEWRSNLVVPHLLPAPPPYLTNVNYGEHLCIHLGNEITPAQARHKPKSLE